jgi:purine nucleosidase
MPTHLIIDTDPGIDDAMTLMLAMASPEVVDGVVITAVHGNVGVDQTYRNARGLVRLAGRPDVEVFKGTEKPLLRDTLAHATDVHGADGLHGLKLPDMPEEEGRDAVAAIVETVNAAPKPVTIIALGALTNIAKALELDPDLPSKIDRLIVMGGAFENPEMGISRCEEGRVGNITPYAEFNMYVDPDAAAIVMAAFPKIDLYPLNLTRQVLATREFTKVLRDSGYNLAINLAGMLDAYLKGNQPEPLHDVNTLMGYLKPEFYHAVHQGTVSVEVIGELMGMTKFEANPAGNVRVVTGAKASQILGFLQGRLLDLARQ